MSSLNEACQALADAAATVDGLRAKPHGDDNINAPEAQVFNRDFDPRLTMGGSPKRLFALTVRVYVPRMNPRSAQFALRDFMEQTGPTSVLAALEDEDNWVAGVDMVEVVQIGATFEATTESGSYLGADFDVDIIL